MKDLQVATQLGEENVPFWAQPQRVDLSLPRDPRRLTQSVDREGRAGAPAFALLEPIVLGYHSVLVFLLDASP